MPDMFYSFTKSLHISRQDGIIRIIWLGFQYDADFNCVRAANQVTQEISCNVNVVADPLQGNRV